ncbi:MAG: hypothetical protein K8S56_04575 [Candidatus Cloacimonetes bacterium]|nr:hypothetical protein [Candidatus Cloacimonadota bacterium]
MQRLWRVCVKSGVEDFIQVTVNADEMARLRPATQPHVLSLLFLRGYVHLLPTDMAMYLEQKYAEIDIVDEHGERLCVEDDLSAVSGTRTQRLSQLFSEAVRCGLDIAGLSETEMKLAIRLERRYLRQQTAIG